MNDPNIVTTAPNVASLLDSASGSREGLRDRARGAMLGLAAGNLLGLPVEGWHHREIDRSYYEGVTDIDSQEAFRLMDDDLAQAVDLGEALLERGNYIGRFADRLVTWARENGRGMGILTNRVIRELEAGHAPPEAARLVYEQRQSFWPDDNYFGRSVDRMIWYPGRCQIDQGSTGSSTEAEADGRQDTTGSGGSVRYK